MNQTSICLRVLGACVLALLFSGSAMAQNALAKPEGVSAMASYMGAITVRWQAVEGAENYTIEKSESGAEESFTELAAVSASTLFIRETGLPYNTEVYYRVKATATSTTEPIAASTAVSSPYSDVVSATTNPDDIIRIMPLGDSNTEGGSGSVDSNERIGYRKELYRKLVVDGSLNGYKIDFVGDVQMGQSLSNEFYAENGFELDLDHAGYGGARNQDIVDLLEVGKFKFYDTNTYRGPGNGPYLYNYNPDVILLHIGTNEVSDSQQAVDYIRTILNQIDSFEQANKKEVLVVLAKIILTAGSKEGINDKTIAYNTKVQAMVEARVQATGDQVILADMQEGAGLVYHMDWEDVSGDMADNLHPNQSGYDKMAAEWFKSLSPVLASAAAPLPVELMHFNASISDNEVLLSWSTASEEENHRFELERMLGNNGFQVIGTVAGAGNSHQRINYTFQDANAPVGTLFYRLKQVDTDGTSTYSKIISVTNLQKQAQAVMVYPNPVLKTQDLYLQGAGYSADTPVTLELFSSLGKRLHTQQETTSAAGLLQAALRLPAHTQAGIYVVRINAFGKTESLRLVVQ